jgi:hypothetical protein
MLVMKMGDIGIDKWCMRMDEHRRKGHQIIKYGDIKYSERRNKNTVDEIKKELLLKARRVKYWEEKKRIPKRDVMFLSSN